MTNEPPIITRMWRVHFTLPNPNVSEYRQNHWCGVLAQNCEDALNVVKMTYPLCKIQSVNNGGNVHFKALDS
jgi:hypothetical protein